MHRILKYRLDHVAFWTVTFLFYAFTRKELLSTSGWFYFAADVLLRNVLLAATCYLNIYLLFERLFRKGKYLGYVTALIGLLAAYTALQNGIGALLRQDAAGDVLYNTYYNFSIGIFYIAFTLALELSKRWYQQQLLLHKIQTEKLEAELQYLKAQLNPHFLFNCINSIFFQINKENSAARESLQQFSDLLRYQLYECNGEQILIEKEMMYLKSYVDLQRLRKNNSRIFFNAHDDMKGFYIAPLLLLPFVENAFKHVADEADAERIIDVDIQRENGLLVFRITNTADFSAQNSEDRGIGLKNVRRRLDLLYNDRYTLNIEKTMAEYSVKLQIKLS